MNLNGEDIGFEFFRWDGCVVVESSGKNPFGVDGGFLFVLVVVDAHGEVARYISRSAPTSSSLAGFGVAGYRTTVESLEVCETGRAREACEAEDSGGDGVLDFLRLLLPCCGVESRAFFGETFLMASVISGSPFLFSLARPRLSRSCLVIWANSALSRILDAS